MCSASYKLITSNISEINREPRNIHTYNRTCVILMSGSSQFVYYFYVLYYRMILCSTIYRIGGNKQNRSGILTNVLYILSRNQWKKDWMPTQTILRSNTVDNVKEGIHTIHISRNYITSCIICFAIVAPRAFDSVLTVKILSMHMSEIHTYVAFISRTEHNF